MTTAQPHSPEIPASAGKDEAAAAQDALVKRRRQVVEDIFAGKPEVEYVPADQVPDTSLLNKKGELVDGPKLQRIADAEQRVIDAIETMPIPLSLPFEDVSPNKDVPLN